MPLFFVYFSLFLLSCLDVFFCFSKKKTSKQDSRKEGHKIYQTGGLHGNVQGLTLKILRNGM